MVTVPITVRSRALGCCYDGGTIVLQGGRWGCAIFGVSFSLIPPGTGYQKKAIFLEPVEQFDTNDNRQQIPLLRIPRYDGGPAQRRRRRAARLVFHYATVAKRPNNTCITNCLKYM